MSPDTNRAIRTACDFCHAKVNCHPFFFVIKVCLFLFDLEYTYTSALNAKERKGQPNAHNVLHEARSARC